MALFPQNAPWQQAASHVQAFEISGDMAFAGADSDLAQIINGLRLRHVDLVVGIGPLSGFRNGAKVCGVRVEGYSSPGGTLAEAQHIKRLGGDVQYFAMDEPLYYGHIWSGPSACHSSVGDIAKEIADKFRQVRTVFPQAQFGEVEPMPVPGVPVATWLADLEGLFDGFQASTGQKIAFFRIDVVWSAPWQPWIPPLAQLLRRKGIPLQVIYDSNGPDANASDARAVAGTIAIFKKYESDGRSAPDVAAIQWWTKHPSHALPETDPTSGTYLIDQYVKWRQSRH
jgi:hypothetical protein